MASIKTSLAAIALAATCATAMASEGTKVVYHVNEGVTGQPSDWKHTQSSECRPKGQNRGGYTRPWH